MFFLGVGSFLGRGGVFVWIEVAGCLVASASASECAAVAPRVAGRLAGGRREVVGGPGAVSGRLTTEREANTCLANTCSANTRSFFG